MSSHTQSNIYPEFERMMPRNEKEHRLRQRGSVIWMYGLSGSGKSTLANALERSLYSEGFFTQILDGDNVRSGLNRDLGFSEEDRTENIRRIAEVAKLFAHAGVVTISSFITPFEVLRHQAKAIVGQDDFVDIYVKASFETCAARDPKGLYAKVLRGEVDNFTGKDQLFEEPDSLQPALTVDTETHDLNACLEQVLTFVRPWITRQ